MLDIKSPTFRDELKTARKAAGLSGASLSTKIGISPGMVSRYESHNRNDGVLPGEDTLKKINDALFGDKSTSEVASTEKLPQSDNDLQKVADSLPLPVLIKAVKKHGAKEIVF